MSIPFFAALIDAGRHLQCFRTKPSSSEDEGILPFCMRRCHPTSQDVSEEENCIWDLNGAFDSQAVYCVPTLVIDEGKINLNGGATPYSNL